MEAVQTAPVKGLHGKRSGSQATITDSLWGTAEVLLKSGLFQELTPAISKNPFAVSIY